MVLNKFTEIASAASSRLSAPKTSTVLYASSRASADDFSVARSSVQKNNLQHSSSLQDFSAYRLLDPEEVYLDLGNKRTLTHAKLPRVVQKENDDSRFSKEKISQGLKFGRKKWALVATVFICLLLCTFLAYTLQYFYFKWSQGPSKYYVVLDCGSTGTRVYVYQATYNNQKDDSLPFVLRSLPLGLSSKHVSQNGRAYNRMETEPGFSKLVYNTTGLRAAIEPLLLWAEKHIPERAHKTTSLFLYATAGVRRLPSTGSDWLLNNAWSIMKNSPFLCEKGWVKIITGMEEANYGWIALNYHTGVLGAKPRKDTFGALDLGGSSLQVTFESKEDMHNEPSVKLSIGSVNHHLSAYSLPGYGLNDAFDRSVTHLLKSSPNVDLIGGNIQIKHPCLHSGYKEQYICSQCASIYEEESHTVGRENIFGKGGKPGISVQLIGAPRWDECRALAKVAVNFSEWSELIPDNMPRPRGQFYAMSGFFVVYRFFNLSSDATLDDVLEKGQAFCEKPWNIAKKSVVPQPLIEQYCFRTPYIVLLLREGLYINDSQVIVDSGSITWTLGVALLEAGKEFPTKLPLHGYESLDRKINPVILFTIIFISLFFLVFALSYIGDWMPSFFRRSYLPLFRRNNASTTSVFGIPSPFSFQRRSPMSKVAVGRPRISGSSSSIDLTGISLEPSTGNCVSHSYSSDSLGEMQLQCESSSSHMGSLWSLHRSQMNTLQSRRSQSREDLISSLTTTE